MLFLLFVKLLYSLSNWECRFLVELRCGIAVSKSWYKNLGSGCCQYKLFHQQRVIFLAVLLLTQLLEENVDTKISMLYIRLIIY